MNETVLIGAAMAAFVILVTVIAGLRRRRQHAVASRKLAEAKEANAHIPQSLYPLINPDVCIGSFSCLKACPEGDILGVMDDRPLLVSPSHCIGHGKCASECPVDAIKLVIGTAERGVDLPEVSEFFESSRPGVHVVGELGGMGLIKNAMAQGVQCSRYLGSQMKPARMANAVDVAIVGSGPAGIATALGLREANLSFRILEQNAFGGTVAQYPRQKLVMSEVVELPLVGRFGKSEMSKEDLIDAWNQIAGKANLQIEEGIKVSSVEGQDGRFTVQTSKGPLYARKVVLATGRRGSPRRLGAPGDELPKVSYALVNPDQYQDCSVLVVGGGDSALEAAIQLANETNAAVALSYRGSAFGKCRQANREKITALADRGRVNVVLDSVVTRVLPDAVELKIKEKAARLDNDYVLTCLGGELPKEFLEKCGVNLKRHHGVAIGEGAAAKPGKAPAGRVERERRHRRFVVALWTLGACVIAGLWWKGSGYYPLAHLARLKSPLHKALKPSGPWGHWVGIVATGVMMLNYLYALRKRWSRALGWGNIRYWLSFHIFVGSMSPMVIAFHAAFQSNNQLASATAASMVVLVTTGLIGRWLVKLVPQRDGKVVELDELKQQLAGLKNQVAALLQGRSGGEVAALQRLGEPALAGGGGLGDFAREFAEDSTLSLVRSLRRSRHLFDDEGQFKDFSRSLAALARVGRQVRFYGMLRRYLAVWRGLHVGLSLFMVVLITAHVGVSLYLGFNPLHSH